MDTLSALVNLLLYDDKKAFRLFLQKRNKRDDVRNIILFDLINTDDINGLDKLYKKAKNRDSYHALRKRLQDNLLLFLSQKTFERNSSQSAEVMRLIVVSRYLLENNLDKTAFKSLAKAEQLAVKLEEYNLLNDVLLLRIQYAHSAAAENLELLTARLVTNQQHMQRETKLNLAYAFLRQELRDVNLNGKVVNLTTLMMRTIRKYQIAVSDLMTYKSIYQILFIANEYAAIYHDYRFIERYIKRIHHFLKKQTKTNEQQLFYHLYVLYFLANFHFRNKDFAQSDKYIAEMQLCMDGNSVYSVQFYARQQLMSALNLYFTGNDGKAILLLQHMLTGATQKYKQEDVEDLRICLTMFLSLRQDKNCLRQLAMFQHTDQWYEKKMGMLWTIRKNLMEILIHAQFEHLDLAMSRLNSFKRRYSAYLASTHEERVLKFVSFVEKYLIKPDVVFHPAFQQDVHQLLKANQDIFHLCFLSWLMATWKKKSAYQIVLEHLAVH